MEMKWEFTSWSKSLSLSYQSMITCAWSAGRLSATQFGNKEDILSVYTRYKVFNNSGVCLCHTGITTCHMPPSLYMKLLFWNESHCFFFCGYICLQRGTFICCCFTVPLLSRVCPSDVCRIWKSGASLRVDATLLGFENMTWIRGRRSYIFRGDGVCVSTFSHNAFYSVSVKIT